MKKNKNKKKIIKNTRSRAGKRSAAIEREKAKAYARFSVEGTLDCKGDRFGFIVCEDGDVFISGRNLAGARHGDRVKAVVIGERGGKREGKVEKIIERSPFNIVATVVYEKNIFFAVPDDRHYGEKLEIVSLGGASEHDKVIIELSERDGEDVAKVIAVLGRFDEIGMDVKSVIAAHALRTEFPPDALSQADALPDSFDPDILKEADRRDLRDKIIFTIDGEGSKDFDDAVSIERTDGGYRLGVYIADVSQYVTAGSPLDREAYARGTSVYLADRVIPMLPEKLSNGICSLNEGEDRPVVGVTIDLDGDGYRVGYELFEGVIRSAARLTYTGVQAMLDGDEEIRKRFAAVVPSLELMKELTEKRIRLRKARGAIDFDLTETEIKFDELGRVKDIAKKKQLLSMRMIEEFMILANCAVAEKFAKAKLPLVFRVHERPPAEKLQALNDYFEAIGARLHISLTPSPKQVADMLRAVEPSSAAAINKMTLRAMSKAAYEPRNRGHFGLAEDFYCHFTSPIRRYPDLVVHRAVKALLRGGAAKARLLRDMTTSASLHCSETERVAQDCERKVDDYKKAEYMSHKIGERYTGTVSSVTDFGFFVELDNSAEGLVRMSALPPAAHFDARTMRISCGMKRYAIGERVDIVVSKVEGDRIDFTLA